ncbi:MAG: phage tail protein [Gaiellaceae bacterium]
MADPFVAEIRIFGFNFAPRGWAFCNGQLLPLSQNTALFSLLGTMYGGDGKSTFALPNIQGSSVMEPRQGPGLSDHVEGEMSGSQTVTLLQSELPAHSHAMGASADDADLTAPSAGRSLATSQGGFTYGPAANLSPLSPQALASAGGSLPHNNFQPYLTINFCIALQGVFPPRG